MDIKYNNRDPVYVQVIRQFKKKIAMGIYEPDEEIPSRRELANQLKINPNTAQRAYKEMEELGLIYTEGNLPSRITRDVKILQSVREELIVDAVEEFVASLRSINVPLKDALNLVEKKYSGEQEG